MVIPSVCVCVCVCACVIPYKWVHVFTTLHTNWVPKKKWVPFSGTHFFLKRYKVKNIFKTRIGPFKEGTHLVCVYFSV